MSLPPNFSIKARNFKCFGADGQGFECIKPLNLIIGRNNAGKSSLLDLIQHACAQNPTVPDSLRNLQNRPALIASLPMTERQIRAVFREDMGGGDISGNHYDFAKPMIGSYLSWNLLAKESGFDGSIAAPSSGKLPLDTLTQRGFNVDKYVEQLCKHAINPCKDKVFRRISAERNITPETDSSISIDIMGDGQGATNAIQNFINKASLPSDRVESLLLAEINSIFRPDTTFKRIVCQQHTDAKWEIYLDEDGKGRIPLSQSGSGLKTVILVMAFIHLLPYITKKPLKEFIFAFEELENNLHPSLLRRLLAYIRKKAVEEEATFFLTTHSSVAIDMFSKDDQAQILHVTHGGRNATVRTIRTYVDSRGILDDLDIRASDLLQANGVIWVEGPSDRIYLNHWIHLWSEGTLLEGQHYQCVFYGGRLLSHLSADAPDSVDQEVAILRINRNAVLVIDSDKRAHGDTLNTTKQRVISEIEKMGGYAWVTEGREVENYLPPDAVTAWLKEETKQDMGMPFRVGEYEDFFECLDQYMNGLEFGKKYRNKKPLLAEKLRQYSDRENLSRMMGLEQKIEELCRRIRRWNCLGIDGPSAC